MTSTNLQSLRNLQASLNASLESYITSLKDPSSKAVAEKAHLGEQVTDTASQVIDAIQHPFMGVGSLGLLVR